MTLPYRERAQTAARSARLLAAQGDSIGAVNRAYYALFDAARAALEKQGGEGIRTKTHSGLIRVFSRELIRTGILDAELGRIIRRTERERLFSDYEAHVLNTESVTRVLADMDVFLAAIEIFLQSPGSSP